jgi:hypothetical protein
MLELAHAICDPKQSEVRLLEVTNRLLAVGHSSGLLWLSGFTEILTAALR